MQAGSMWAARCGRLDVGRAAGHIRHRGPILDGCACGRVPHRHSPQRRTTLPNHGRTGRPLPRRVGTFNTLGRTRTQRLKASIRPEVEPPFHGVKDLFRHRKTRYCGLAKNTAQLLTLFGLANRMPAGRCCPNTAKLRPESGKQAGKPPDSASIRGNRPGLKLNATCAAF